MLVYYTIVYYTILYYSILHHDALYYSIEEYTGLYYTILHYTTCFLHYTAAYHPMSISSAPDEPTTTFHIRALGNTRFGYTHAYIYVYISHL
jgi:hypothetical protein